MIHPLIKTYLKFFARFRESGKELQINAKNHLEICQFGVILKSGGQEWPTHIDQSKPSRPTEGYK